jgi:hypothetical protein
MEPDFLSQNGESITHTRLQWFAERAKAAEAKGATWHRFSVHPDIGGLILYEGWKQKPVDDDGNLNEGKPRWQFSPELA